MWELPVTQKPAAHPTGSQRPGMTAKRAGSGDISVGRPSKVDIPVASEHEMTRFVRTASHVCCTERSPSACAKRAGETRRSA
jgi:hypothetical protein